MTTSKNCIINEVDELFIENKQNNYSYGFRMLYKMIEESSNEEFINRFKERFDMNDIEYRSLLSDVSSFIKRERKQKEKTVDKINDLTDELCLNDLTKKERFKALNSIAYHKSRLDKEPTFGGLKLIRNITRECNKPVRDEEKIKELRDEFHRKRTLPYQIMGEANRGGNRFFDLSRISKGIVIYKPHKGFSFEIRFNVKRNKADDFRKLEEMIKNNEISVTVSLSKIHIYFTYDEEKLHGYSVDEVSRRKEVKDIKSKKYSEETQASLVKDVYRKYFDEQRYKKLQGKVPGRCISIDMNPEYIGFSIIDKANNDIDIVYNGVIDLTRLCRKSGKSSSSSESRYLKNKRIYEITVIVKELFKIAMHFGCSSFVIEDLNFKEKKSAKKKSKEFNRKTKTVWNRELLVSCIRRRCNETGVELIEINPVYTSFIGNIKHGFYDPCNASIEIGRRGLFKYTKGEFYPQVTTEDVRTLEAKFGDVVECSTDSNWVDIYKSLRNKFDKNEFSYRLRTRLEDVETSYRVFSMNSYKSNIKFIIFN